MIFVAMIFDPAIRIEQSRLERVMNLPVYVSQVLVGPQIKTSIVAVSRAVLIGVSPVPTKTFGQVHNTL